MPSRATTASRQAPLIVRAVSTTLFALAITACNGASSDDAGADAYNPVDAATGTAQTPPMGAANVEAWLATGAYLHWHCESAVRPARSPSPHGYVRVCSNDVLAANATSTGPWPAGVAAVKELYDSATGTTPVGFAVYWKTTSDTSNGANWYWYERVPLSSGEPHDSQGVVADGLGASGTAMSYCVSCHSLAGTDTEHTPTPGGRDMVYTPIQ